jgi:repressor LexA
MTETVKLTPRQAEILAFVRQQILTAGAPPTRAEIAHAFGFKSANAAEEHLRALAKKGLLEVQGGTSRGIRLLGAVGKPAPAPEGGPQLLHLPLVGRVAAGSPVLAQEHVEQFYSVPARFFAKTPDFLLRVRGLSMRDAGILDGDMLAVKATREAQDGQIVVARLGDEVTVKRLQRQTDAVELHPANPDFAVLRVLAHEPLVIEGVVVGLWRDTGWF